MHEYTVHSRATPRATPVDGPCDCIVRKQPARSPDVVIFVEQKGINEMASEPKDAEIGESSGPSGADLASKPDQATVPHPLPPDPVGRAIHAGEEKFIEIHAPVLAIYYVFKSDEAGVLREVRAFIDGLHTSP
jgi:hypothetical protein